ncbi:aldo/keto reductase [Candidatus Bathyarchaeota archaeon]|nr:aldo/keto reductase [Candidatus Bathyarchaeota archaeon]
MEYKELAKGVKIPVLGLGTWGIGGWETPDPSGDDENIASLRAGIELGMTHIDTAEMYGGGHCEEVVGEAIKPYDRDELFITTKVWRTHLRYDDVISAIKGSLRRLGLDYVDLYLVHWPNPKVPLKETMRAMELCAEEGYTRFIGVSNFGRPLLEEAQSYLKEHRLVADQVEYNLLEQGPRENLLPYCQREGIMLIAYTPLAKGRLAMPGSPMLDEMAEKYGKTPGQIALNWLIFQDWIVAIPKASKIEHLKENLGAVGWRLSPEDWRKLGEAYRRIGPVY